MEAVDAVAEENVGAAVEAKVDTTVEEEGGEEKAGAVAGGKACGGEETKACVGARDTVELAEVAPTEMVSTRVSDRDGVRTAALALLDGPNTVVCSSEPVHSPSQSSEAAVGSSSQLSILRLFWVVLSSLGGPQVSMDSGKLGACLFWNVRGPMDEPRPRPPLPLVAAVPLVSLPRRVLSPRPGPSKFSLSRPPRPLPPPRPLNLGGPPPLGRDPLRSRELTRRFSLLLSVSVVLPVTGFFFFFVDSCHLP